MRSKIQLAEKYTYVRIGDVENIADLESAFLAGYDAATRWKKVEEELPDNDRTVLVKVKDCKRPQENIMEVSLRYYNEYKEWRYQHTSNLINSGHGWFIEEWTEIPK